MGGRGVPQRAARALGDEGEQLVSDRLREQGWQILERNWRCDIGELDIVALDGDVMVFCEVKTRRSHRYGTPVEAVTPQKARRLRRLAMRWLADHGRYAPRLRIDVVGVTRPRRGPAVFQHLRGVA